MTVTKIFDKGKDCKMLSLVSVLDEAREELKEGGAFHEFNGLIVIGVKRMGGLYKHGYRRAGIHHSETIALLEITKDAMLMEMRED